MKKIPSALLDLNHFSVVIFGKICRSLLVRKEEMELEVCMSGFEQLRVVTTNSTAFGQTLFQITETHKCIEREREREYLKSSPQEPMEVRVKIFIDLCHQQNSWVCSVSICFAFFHFTPFVFVCEFCSVLCPLFLLYGFDVQ